jgi:hypothetical protein
MIKGLLQHTAFIVPKEEAWSIYYIGFAAQGWTKLAHDTAEKLAQSTADKRSWRVAGIRLMGLDQVNAELVNWQAMLH